jgi:hypothetical protein
VSRPAGRAPSAVSGTLGLRAVALTTYTPSRDVDDATHATALHILARIADHYAAT